MIAWTDCLGQNFLFDLLTDLFMAISSRKIKFRNHFATDQKSREDVLKLTLTKKRIRP
jgi:hypothetical protein